jgi:hypothetical protein
VRHGPFEGGRVHTVWMELHEDYLRTPGISREAEDS